jgi:uncharacterized protein
MIRFVAGPDMSVVPDLKRQLPGRGCWVTADRAHVDTAVARKLFARGLKAEVAVRPDLGEMIDALLARNALGALGLARKSGQLVLGAAKVESAVRTGKAQLVLHAHEASSDGVRKIDNARRAVVYAGGPNTPSYRLFSEAEMSLALGGSNVIHAALLAGDTGRAIAKRLEALDRYRGGSPMDRMVNADVRHSDGVAEEAE